MVTILALIESRNDSTHQRLSPDRPKFYTPLVLSLETRIRPYCVPITHKSVFRRLQQLGLMSCSIWTLRSCAQSLSLLRKGRRGARLGSDPPSYLFLN